MTTIQPQANRTYHFVITVQKQNKDMSTRSGLYTAPAGAGRDEAFSTIVSHHFPGHVSNLVVLFFDLRPNTL